MLRALGLKRLYEPKPRAFHYAGAVRGELLVFAGWAVDFGKTEEELSSTCTIQVSILNSGGHALA